MCDEVMHPQKCVERIVIDNEFYEQLDHVLNNLPKIQRRRFYWYHKYGMTCKQIAKVEGCTFQAVSQSINLAEKEIIKYFSYLP